MSQLMLINPRSRKKPRSAAQKAATKKMLAANRSRGAGKPARAKKRRAVAVRKSNPIGLSRVKRVASTRKRRRNPLALPSAGNVGKLAMVSVQGAGGALLVNTALNYIPMLPAALKSGNGKYLARAGLAIAVGVFGSRLLPKQVAENMAIGAMTVALHDLMLGIASKAMPTLRLGDVGDYDDGVSAYIDGLSDAEMEGLADADLEGLADMSAVYSTYDSAGNVGEYVS